MKIKIKREGGFIGITSKANLEFDELTVDEQKAFNLLAEQSLQTATPKPVDAPNLEPPVSSETKARDMVLPNVNGLEPVSPSINGLESVSPNADGLELAAPQMSRNMPNHQMRDGFSYSVSMKKDGKTMSMKFDDMNAPPEIVEIFQKYVQY